MGTEPSAAGAEPALAEIVPRWEWRTFGETFGAADRLFAESPPERVQESDEVYLLSLESDASVKIRDGLLDVKELQHVNGDGLEQWRPVLKAPFPLSPADVETMLAALGVGGPEQTREAYTLDELLDEVVGGSEALRAVKVHKHRARYSPDGCMAESTGLTTDRGSTKTVAIEATDAAAVIGLVRRLELDARPNVCLARGLKTLIGFEAIRYGVIDVGTNSVKFHVGEHRPSGAWRTVVDRAEITRLGEGVDESGRLAPEPIGRTVAAIVGMVDEARSEGAAAIAAVGTAALRTAQNSDDLVAAVRERCGVGVEIISGEEEARLAYRAATAAIDVGRGSLAVFDTGGGSSQFTFGKGGRISEQFSVDVGAVRFTERFGLGGPVSDDALAEALEAIATDFAKLDGRPTPGGLVGMGGAVTNLTAVKHELATYDPDVVQGTVLDRGEIDRQIELYRTSTVEQRRRIPGLQPKRADVILAGACIVRTVLDKLGCESFTVSDHGLRHGLLVERFG